MDEQDLSELQSEEIWESGDEVETPVRPRKARAVVSVSFPGDDFERVDEYAEQHGLKISELIRRATLQYVSGRRRVVKGQVLVMSAGGPAQMTAYLPETTPSTLASPAAFDPDEMAHT